MAPSTFQPWLRPCCCKAHAKINRKWEIRTPAKSHTFACEITSARLPNMQILVSIREEGTSLQAKLYHFVTLLTSLSLPFSQYCAHGRTAAPILTLCGSNNVFRRKDGPFFWGGECENCQRQSCKAFIGLTNRAKIIGGGDPLYLKFWIKLTALERNRRFLFCFRS